MEDFSGHFFPQDREIGPERKSAKKIRRTKNKNPFCQNPTLANNSETILLCNAYVCNWKIKSLGVVLPHPPGEILRLRASFTQFLVNFSLIRLEALVNFHQIQSILVHLSQL